MLKGLMIIAWCMPLGLLSKKALLFIMSVLCKTPDFSIFAYCFIYEHECLRPDLTE